MVPVSQLATMTNYTVVEEICKKKGWEVPPKPKLILACDVEPTCQRILQQHEARPDVMWCYVICYLSVFEKKNRAQGVTGQKQLVNDKERIITFHYRRLRHHMKSWNHMSRHMFYFCAHGPGSFNLCGAGFEMLCQRLCVGKGWEDSRQVSQAEPRAQKITCPTTRAGWLAICGGSGYPLCERRSHQQHLLP